MAGDLRRINKELKKAKGRQFAYVSRSKVKRGRHYIPSKHRWEVNFGKGLYAYTKIFNSEKAAQKFKRAWMKKKR